MVALLLALLPNAEAIPAVESIEANYVVSRVRHDVYEWHTAGWDRSLSQVILRDPHPRTKRIEIRDWAGGGQSVFAVRFDNGFWYVTTNKGTVRSRTFFETFTDYDPERLEAADRLPQEHRLGWPK